MRLFRELGWTLLCALVAWITYAGMHSWTWDLGSLTPSWVTLLFSLHTDLSMYTFALVLVAIRHGTRLCATLEPRHLAAGLGLTSTLAAISALSWWHSREMLPLGIPRRYAKYADVDADGAWQGLLHFTLPWQFATFAAGTLCIYLVERLCRELWIQRRTGAKP